MAKEIELRRHTDNDGDALTPEGVAAALELVEQDSAVLGAALRRVFDALPEGGRALAVGHSPTNEAAVLGLTGEIVAPLTKGAGVRVLASDDGFRVERLE